MAFSNYPHGFKNGLTVRGVPLDIVHPGRVFWVGNNATRLDNEKTASDGNDGTFLAPFSTLEGALNTSAVRAARGDVIFVRPGHTIAVTAETSLALDKAGVAIIGLGTGTSRPTITHTAPSGTILVTAANITVKNFLHLVAGTHTLGVDKAFHISATDFTGEDLEFRDLGTSAGFVQVIQLGGGANATDNQADRANFSNVKYKALQVAGNTKSLPFRVEAVTDGIVISDAKIFLGGIGGTAGGGQALVSIAPSYNVTNLLVKEIYVMNAAASATAGVQATVVQGGGTGAAGSGGNGVLVRCYTEVGTTLSNNRYIGVDALTNGILSDCHMWSGLPEATTSRDIVIQTLLQPAQFS